MNKLFFLVCSLFYCSLFYTQKIDNSYMECKYLSTFLVDTLDTNTKKEELLVLRIGEKMSIFRSEHKMIKDSLQLSIIDETMKNPKLGTVKFDFSQLPKSSFTQEVYKKNNDIWIYDIVSADKYVFQPPNILDWKITNEKKKISTYNCKKAISKYGNRNITAWFTEDIPIPEGPYTFKGLPGLIIEAYDEKKYFHFRLVKLINTEKPIIPIEESLIKTDYKKFSTKRNEFKNDPTAIIRSKGYPVSKEWLENSKKIQQRKNNYLD